MNQIIIIIITGFALASCKKFLDAKPDRSVAVPSTLQDIQALLDNESNLNTRNPGLSEIAADNYYLSYLDWLAVSTENDGKNYIWAVDAELPNNWSGPYKSLLYANTVLDNLEKIPVTISNSSQWNNCRGQALFFRAYIFFHLAQVYCKAWDNNGNNESPGIPLKLTADIDEPITRSSVKQTYEQLHSDVLASISMLQVDNMIKTRPNKAAAFGLMARICLAMQEYHLAGLYADSCLQLYNQLIDYNAISTTAALPFPKFNNEIIFYCESNGAGVLNASVCKVDSLLFSSYHTNDLRRAIFFKNNNNGSYAFKGGYNGTMTNFFFNGIATDEILLIKAESLARKNDASGAMNTLNTLMIKRWKTGTFVPFTAADAEQALRTILAERRKELLFRGLRWQDLRRLNKDARFSKTLTRSLNGQLYQLPPGDLRYVMLIPLDVIALNGIQQNPR